MSTATYTVGGMTCGHCVNSGSEEVGRLPGVMDVNVELATGADRHQHGCGCGCS